MKRLKAVAMVGLLGISALSYANDVYIQQAGNSSTINITQQGIGNNIGSSITSIYIGGGSNAVTIDQIGDNNALAMVINGSAAASTLSYTGSDNTITIDCGTTVSAGCSSSTINHTVLGDTNTITQNLGGGANHTSNITITGDSNTVTHTSTATGTTVMNATITGNLNGLTVTQSGMTAQSVVINATGNSNTIAVTQSN